MANHVQHTISVNDVLNLVPARMTHIAILETELVTAHLDIKDRVAKVNAKQDSSAKIAPFRASARTMPRA